MSESPQILAAMNAVQLALSKEGITKDRKNAQQGFAFRGIDDVMNALSPLFAEHGIVLLPAYSERTVTERETKNGGTLFYTALKGTFTFRSKADGSYVEVTTYGEAMDSGDKSTNKAMAAAMKYAMLQALIIPTEGDNDADATTHEVAPRQPARRVEKPEPYKATGPLITDATKAAILKLTEDAAILARCDNVLVAKKVPTLGELSEEDALKLLTYLQTKPAAK